MSETEEDIQAYIWDKLREVEIYKIAVIYSKCKSETFFFEVLDEMVVDGVVAKDDNLIWLP